MHSSTVKRRRLISPLGLTLIASLFLVAFLLLKSGSISPLQSNSSPLKKYSTNSRVESQDSLDTLELAYLKVRKDSGEVSDARIGEVVVGLLRVGRVEEAKQLLSDVANLDLDASQRLMIDLELAARESQVSLVAVLLELAGSPLRYEPTVLARAVELSKPLAEPALSVRLFELHAMHEKADTTGIYSDCGQYLLSIDEKAKAADCYRQGLSAEEDPKARFDLQLALMPLMPAENGERQTMVQQFLDNDSMSVVQMTQLAPALLAVEHPEAAYRIYARLALRQPARAGHWLPLAARWAQAANRPVDAAVFLDALAKQVDEGEKLALFKQVETLLIGAGRDNEAFKRVKERLQRGQSAPEELRYGVQFALQIGDTKQARIWNEQWLSINPDDVEALQQQIDLALAETDLASANQTAERLAKLLPQDRSVRERLAQISEWNGQISRAKEQWLWLAIKQNQPQESKRLHALHQIVRLSKQTYDAASAARALRELTLLVKPDNDQITDLVRLYVDNGQPIKASVALNDINIVHGASAFTLRTLADHEYDHGNYSNSLAAWNQYETHFGSTAQSTLNRVELLWRLDNKTAAVDAASALKGRTLLSQASDFQLRVLAEIAWQHRQPWLDDVIRPRIAMLENQGMRARYGRRTVQALRETGRDEEAIAESIKLWSNTGKHDFALSAMDMALRVGNQQVLEQFSPEQGRSKQLQDKPEYWLKVAAIRLRESENDGARSAYVRALNIDPDSTEAAAGIIWMDIGASDSAGLQKTLDKYKPLADDNPALWQAMAVGYLQLGAASTSLEWFDRSLDQIKTDYSMLLTYADALEYAGRAADALEVREYTLQQLRPVLVNGAQEEQDLLLRQYAKLSSRYAGAAHTETLVDYLMVNPASEEDSAVDESLWREDIAISWLMSTQRLEQARILMANLHSKRLQAPAWQRMALALKDSDQQALQEMLAATGPLSVGNHILALRQLGNDREAYAMAQVALNAEQRSRAVTYSDVQIASEQYAYLREVLPSFVSGGVQARQFDQLSTTERGFTVRHTIAQLGIGVGLRATQRTMESQRFIVDGVDEMSDVALSLFFGNAQRGGSITAGLLATDDSDVSHGMAQWYRRSVDQNTRYAVDLAYNETATQSSELVVAGLQHRASVSMETGLGRLPFLRMQADATRITSRENQVDVADGLGAEIELGVRGAVGAHNWSASVRAGQISYRRAAQLPEELQLTDSSTLDSVLAKETQSLSVGATIARGGIRQNFPTVNSPRYFLSARLGHNWPTQELGFQIDSGAGIRILGGDELSFTVRHDSKGFGTRVKDSTALGVHYRYHF